MPLPFARLFVCLFFLGLARPAVFSGPAAEREWRIHEWGTFTSLQDESGMAIAGINADDEPVPDFVWRLGERLVQAPTEAPPMGWGKGLVPCHPDVTLRLETPVVYFYPPSGRGVEKVDLQVTFVGGWLTEYYPGGQVMAPGYGEPVGTVGRINGQTCGQLVWQQLKVGGPWSGPATSSRVWLAPRSVRSAAVQNREGESEKYVFYRGVGHLNAPLRVARTRDGGRFELYPQVALPPGAAVTAWWLVDIRGDGAVAFRPLPSFRWPTAGHMEPPNPVCITPAAFQASDYATGNLPRLKARMQEQLVREGLFGDEAEAMLNTWEESYFQSHGLRLFYIVPRAWTERHLPLAVSVPARLTRVMIGRIELVTPETRQLLHQIATGPPPDLGPLLEEMARHPRVARAILENQASVHELGVPVPPLYDAYLRLGRFRNALILEENRLRPTPALAEFIRDSGLAAAIRR